MFDPRLLGFSIFANGQEGSANRIFLCIKSITKMDGVIGFRGLPNIKVYSDTTQKLTVKKNRAIQESSTEYTVMMHDYFIFDIPWYNEIVHHINVFKPDIISCSQRLITNKRHFTDWVNWDNPTLPKYESIDYDDWDKTKNQYISGGFFVVRSDFLRANLFDETLDWGQSEDVEWSLRIREKAKIICAGDAIVRHSKIHRDAIT